MGTSGVSKEKRREYKIHYNLRRKGNKVDAREKSVIRRAKTLPKSEEKWCKELISKGYFVCDGLFTPDGID